MSAWIGGGVLVVGIVLLIKVFRLAEVSSKVIEGSRNALSVLSDVTLSDDAKETAMQQLAGQLLRSFLLILVAGTAAIFLPLGFVRVLDALNLLAFREVLELAISWPFLLLSLLGGGFLWWALRPAKNKPSRTERDGFEDRYSGIDRMLHQTAFALLPVQIGLSRWEDRLWRRKRRAVSLGKPVFIAGLPRAGTTLLLNLLSGSGAFATHTYRHMPFLLTPLLWEKFARHFRTEDTKRERAHGDGVLVDLDSPEAFEEVIWMAFWKEHYRDTHIVPWKPDEARPEFLRFFHRHMEKLAILAGPVSGEGARRYLSKNNLNIARIRWLVHHLPEARVIVPFRDPLPHAASLLDQHRRFREMHARDRFSKTYMASIGHFDFGANLRPIDFANGGPQSAHDDSTDLAFWLRYWILVYRTILAEAEPQVLMVDFDGLCRFPDRSLAQVAEFVEMDRTDLLLKAASEVRQPRIHEVDTTGVPPSVLEEARATHRRLCRRGTEGRNEAAATSIV